MLILLRPGVYSHKFKKFINLIDSEGGGGPGVYIAILDFSDIRNNQYVVLLEDF